MGKITGKKSGNEEGYVFAPYIPLTEDVKVILDWEKIKNKQRLEKRKETIKNILNNENKV